MNEILQKLKSNSELQEFQIKDLLLQITELTNKFQQQSNSIQKDQFKLKWKSYLPLFYYLTIHELLNLRLCNNQFNYNILNFIENFYINNLQFKISKLIQYKSQLEDTITEQDKVMWQQNIKELNKHVMIKLYNQYEYQDYEYYQSNVQNEYQFPSCFSSSLLCNILLDIQQINHWQIDIYCFEKFQRYMSFVDLRCIPIAKRTYYIVQLLETENQQYDDPFEELFYKIILIWFNQTTIPSYEQIIELKLIKDQIQYLERRIQILNKIISLI